MSPVSESLGILWVREPEQVVTNTNAQGGGYRQGPEHPFGGHIRQAWLRIPREQMHQVARTTDAERLLFTDSVAAALTELHERQGQTDNNWTELGLTDVVSAGHLLVLDLPHFTHVCQEPYEDRGGVGQRSHYEILQTEQPRLIARLNGLCDAGISKVLVTIEHLADLSRAPTNWMHLYVPRYDWQNPGAWGQVEALRKEIEQDTASLVIEAEGSRAPVVRYTLDREKARAAQRKRLQSIAITRARQAAKIQVPTFSLNAVSCCASNLFNELPRTGLQYYRASLFYKTWEQAAQQLYRIVNTWVVVFGPGSYRRHPEFQKLMKDWRTLVPKTHKLRERKELVAFIRWMDAEAKRRKPRSTIIQVPRGNFAEKPGPGTVEYDKVDLSIPHRDRS